MCVSTCQVEISQFHQNTKQGTNENIVDNYSFDVQSVIGGKPNLQLLVQHSTHDA